MGVRKPYEISGSQSWPKIKMYGHYSTWKGTASIVNSSIERTPFQRTSKGVRKIVWFYPGRRRQKEITTFLLDELKNITKVSPNQMLPSLK